MGAQQKLVSLDDGFERAQRGNLIYAEILARLTLQRDPSNLSALNLLGFVAVRAGLIGSAYEIFRRAQAAWPQAGLEATVARLEPMLSAWRARRAKWRKEERFLLIKAWGYGFGADMVHVMGGLLLAELTERTPIIHWGPNSLYSDGTAANAFHYFFEPFNTLGLDDLRPVAARGVFPDKWHTENLQVEDLNKLEGPGSRIGPIYFLDRDEPLAVFDFFGWPIDLIGWIPEGHSYHGMNVGEIYRALWAKYLKPTRRVLDRVERFASKYWPRGQVLAVHVRDGDHRYEQHELLDVNAQYFDIVDRLLAEQPASIYLMTDTTTVIDAFRARYGDLVFVTNAQRTADDTGIHYNAKADRVELGVDLLSDVLLATRADRFVGNGRSNPSCMVWNAKAWPPGSAELIVPCFYDEQSPFWYDY
ncbi:MAG TPA: hypothetical protein VKZ79_25395 [Alphaproteobacteria bacterium]|nr:hypothetical protein [Alphaproteobacteria bacterium]